ncbi:MAG: hypothetical protein GX592_14210 [Clostridiales bacterium]|nr:hypothetical protein [Clostridiales bacterium]
MTDTDTTTAADPTPTPVPFEAALVSAVLSLVTLTDASIPKRSAYDPDTDPGTGVVVAEVTAVELPNHGLNDYFFRVAVSGRTLASEDPDKTIIRTIAGDVLRSFAAMTPAAIGTALSLKAPAACVGILRDNSASVRSSGLDNIFSSEIKIVFTELTF